MDTTTLRSMGPVLAILGSLAGLASAFFAARAAWLATPFQSPASKKLTQLVGALRDYTWASRDVIAALDPVVHDNAPITATLEKHRLTVANAIRKYLDGSARAEEELKGRSMLDDEPELVSASRARAALAWAVITAITSAVLQLTAVALQ